MDGNTVSANTKNLHRFQMQQKAKGLLFIAAIIVPIFIATAAYVTYKNLTSPSNSQDGAGATLGNAEPISGQNNNQTSQATPSTEITAPAPPTTDTPSSTASQSPQGSTPSASGGSSNSSKIPASLNTALKSIEANGIKGSAYVSPSLDLSRVPDGAKVTFDRSTWTKINDRSGSIKGTIDVFGQPTKGTVTFEESGGVWRATGYGLN